MTRKPEVYFDTSGLQEVLFDDIRDLGVHAGIFRCTLYAYRIVPPSTVALWVPVLPVALPVSAVAPVANKALAMVGSETIRAAKEFVRDKVGSLLLH